MGTSIVGVDAATATGSVITSAWAMGMAVPWSTSAGGAVGDTGTALVEFGGSVLAVGVVEVSSMGAVGRGTEV